MPTPKKDATSDRDLVLEFLKGQRTFADEPWLLHEDVLFFAAQRLAAQDPAWLLSQLAKRELEVQLRQTVARNAFSKDVDKALAIIAANS